MAYGPDLRRLDWRSLIELTEDGAWRVLIADCNVKTATRKKQKKPYRLRQTVLVPSREELIAVADSYGGLGKFGIRTRLVEHYEVPRSRIDSWLKSYSLHRERRSA